MGFFLIIIFLYLVAPNIKVGYFSIPDLTFASYFIYLFFAKKINIDNKRKLLWIFIWPTIFVFLSVVGKFFLGFSIGSDEINNLLKMFNLFLISLITISFINKINISTDYLIIKGLFLLSIAVIYISILGIIQYFYPSIFENIFGKYYNIEIDPGVFSIEKAIASQRISSVFHWANALGFFLCLALTIIMFNNDKINYYIVTLALLSGIFALFFTNSRISIVLFILSIFYYMIIIKRKKIILISILLVLILLSNVIIHAISINNINRFWELYDYFNYGIVPVNVQVRLDTLSYLPILIMKSNYVYFGYPIKLYLSTVAISPDNQYLGWFLKYGLLSIPFAFYLLYLIFFPIRIVKKGKINNNNKVYLHTFFFVNTLIFIGGFSQDTLFILRWREFYFFFFPLLLATLKS